MIDMRGMKRSMKLAEWTRLIEQRVESGKTIKVWCEEHGIRRRLYYYWQRRVREEVISSVVLSNACVPGIIPADNAISTPTMIRPDASAFARIPLASTSPPTDTKEIAMSVCIGDTECEIYNGADIDVVERALLTLGKI